jgi:hypothetical protein
MAPQDATVEARIARIASSAWGIVTWKEMRAAAITPAQIKNRIAKGGLIREYPEVYRAGHCAPSAEATYMAAVKAGGEGAGLCDLPAAYLWGLVRRRKAPPPVVVTKTTRKIRGLRSRRSRHRELTTFKGIPVTTVASTLVDLAAILEDDALARACHEAGVKYGTTPAHVKTVLKRRPRSKGAAKLKRIMSGDTKAMLSALEKRFPQRLTEAGLPLPDEMNRVADGRRIDCRWRDHKLTVELLGFRFHNSRHSWDRDHDRAREAYARDDDYREYTYKDVFEDPTRMLSELRKLLA